MADWSEDDLPSLAGCAAIVTGASSGVGWETARALARAGADVTLAVRDPARGDAARAAILARHPNACLRVGRLDLADLSSVRQFAARQRERLTRLDLLINNAGTMFGPYACSADGFERQMATNHLGHFALTGLLLPLLLATPGARVVNVASLAARGGRLSAQTTLADLREPRPYRAGQAYRNSKQANLLFTEELNRRFRARQAPVLSLAAHPGVSATGLATQQARQAGRHRRAWLVTLSVRLLFQSARAGAWPILYAATAPNLLGGELIGPAGRGQVRGRPMVQEVFPAGRDEAAAERLWALSVEATGVAYAEL